MVVAGTADRLKVGDVLGAWRLLRPIDRGTVGDFHLVERADQIHDRRAALLLLPRGLDPDLVLERAKHERRVLAQLAHPAVVHMLDAGEAPDGRPWIVTELVESRPIDAWCESQPLSARDVVRVFASACDAVSEAHRKGVVHGRLSPATVQVTAAGEPKLLDFGMARILAGEATGDAGPGPFAPQFAAPEQQLSGVADPSTDVYALGLLLFQLLTGEPAQRKLSVPEAIAAARTGRVQLPAVSAAIRKERNPVNRAERNRRADECADDLDYVVAKALHPDPARRYANAGELDEDLQRFLESRPVLARPDSRRYRARTYLRRNHREIASVASVVIALVLGIVGLAWVAGDAVVSRDAERARRESAEALSADLREVWAFQERQLRRVNVKALGAAWLDRARASIEQTLSGDPQVSAGDKAALLAQFDHLRTLARPSEIARESLGENLLAPAQAEIATRFADRPAVAARLRASVAQAYADLGLYRRAIDAYDQAIAAQSVAPGPDDPQTLTTRAMRVDLLAAMLDHDQALAEARTIATTRAKALGERHPDTLAARGVEAAILGSSGDSAGAIRLLLPLLDRMRTELGPEHPTTLRAELDLATAHATHGDPKAARPLAEHVLAVRRRTLGGQDPDTLAAMSQLANDLVEVQAYGEARPLYAELFTALSRASGAGQPETLAILNDHGAVEGPAGDRAAALQLSRKAWEAYAHAYGEESPAVIAQGTTYARVLMNEAEYGASAAVLSRVVDLHVRWHGAEHPGTLLAQSRYAAALQGLGRLEEARALLERIVPVLLRVAGPTDRDTLEAQAAYGEVLTLLQRAPESLPVLEKARDGFVDLDGPSGRRVLRIRRCIGDAQRQLGQLNASLSTLEGALADQRRLSGGDDSRELPQMLGSLAATLRAMGRADPARKYAAEAEALERKAREKRGLPPPEAQDTAR